MAQCIKYDCNHCNTSVSAWSDGNPYFINDDGEKVYAYHPNYEDLERCIGNDEPYICLECSESFLIDSRNSILLCSKCNSEQIVSTYELQDKTCPFCKKGAFIQDSNFFVIS